MRTKSILLLVLALGCGLIAAIGVTQVINQDSSAPAPVETANILVAREDISEGRKITPEVVRFEAWPKEKIPQDAIFDLKEAEGFRARTDILLDEPLREKKLLGKGDLRTPTDHIETNMRAVPIKIERDSNTGLIRPGDRVDVLANIRKNTQEGIMQSRTITLLQNVEVFAVDADFRPEPDSEDGKTVLAKTVTLLLTPSQAIKVDMAQQNGKLRIIMRSPDDESVIQDPQGISLGELLGNVPAKPVEKTTPAPVTTPVFVPTNDTWRMRILTGQEVEDVVLEEREGNDGEKVWYIISEKGDGIAKSPSAPAAPKTSTKMPFGSLDSDLTPPGLEPGE